MNLSIKFRNGNLVRIFLALLTFCLWPQAARADHLCAGRSNEYTVTEVYDEFGGVVEAWCEWGSDGAESAAAMRYYSPEEWKAFAEQGAKVEAANAQERMLAGKRYRQLQEGVWFMPGDEPFAGWSSGSTSTTRPGTRGSETGGSCTVSFWTLEGAVTLSAPGGRNGVAVISYMGNTIPAPNKTGKRRFSLTQSGATQTVTATISKVGLGKRIQGMVTFAVPSGNILVGAIEDVQDYRLAENGKTIFSGQWHDGLKARDALARCLAHHP